MFGAEAETPYEWEVWRAIEQIYVDHLIRLSERATMPQVRAEVDSFLKRLQEGFERPNEDLGPAGMAANAQIARDIRRHFERPPAEWSKPSTPSAPPGSPIGSSYRTWIDSPAYELFMGSTDLCVAPLF